MKQQRVEPGASESEHRKRKRRESLSSPASEQPAANGIHTTDSTPGMTLCTCPTSGAWQGRAAARLPAQPLRALSEPRTWLTYPQTCVLLPQGSCPVVPWMRVSSSLDA